MAVTNTVQGLNCVIDLLKNILDATKSNDDKTVQPRDVSSTSRVTANIQSPTIETEGLNSLNSINKRMENKAKSYVSIIKTITSNDTISGIKTLASLQELGVLTMFNKAIDSIVNSLNLLNNMKVTKAKVTNFVTVINSITDIITTFNDIIFSIGKVIFAAVGLGALFIVAWPMILLGFAGVIATMMGVLGIIKIMMGIQKLLFGSGMNTIDSVMNVAVFKMMTEIFLYLGGIVLTAAAIGILSTAIAPYILEGFTWMAGVMIGVLGIMWLASKVSESVKFGLLAIGTIIISLYAISLLIFIAAGVSAFSERFYPQILIGFGWIIGITALITIAVLAISKTKDIAVKYNIIASIGLLAISMIAVGLLVMVMNNVGKTIIDNAGAVFAGIGTMLVMMIALSGLMWVIGKIADSINLASALKGIGLILLLGITISAITLVIQSVINVQDKVKTAGGWSTVWTSVGHIIGILGALAGIAGIAGIPGLRIALGIGLGIIGGITLILLGLSKVIKNVVDTAILINEAREKNAFDGIENAAISIGSAISTLVKELLPSAKSALLLMPAITPLNMLMNTISKFVRIVSKVGGDPNFMVPIETDENGNIKTSYAKVNMESVALNIATAFTSFVETLSSKLKTTDIDGLKNARRVSRLMRSIINPISKFVKVVQNVAKDPNFIASVELNDDDSIKSSGDGVNIGQVAQNIANTFIILVNSIDKHLSSIEMRGGKIRKLAKMEGVVNAIRGTMELLTKFKVTSDGKTHQITLIDDKGQQRTITAEFSGLNELLSSLNTELKDVKTNNIEDLADLTPNITTFHKEWTKLDNIMFSDSNRKLKVLKEYKETMAELCKVLKDMSESTEKISQMKLPDVNATTNNTASNQTKQQTNTSTAVDSQNNKSINNIQPIINTSEIADAIKIGLSGSVVKFTFNDSTEDFIADMLLT